MASKFCSVDDVKPLAGVDPDWTTVDIKLTAQIKRATALIRSYTRREWERNVYTQFFATYDSRCRDGILVLHFDELFVQPTPAPVIKYNRGGRFDLVDPLDANNYTLQTGRNGTITFYREFDRAERALQAVYTAGFPVNAEDAELLDADPSFVAATALQAAFMHRRSEDGESGQDSKANKNGTAAYKIGPSGLIPEVQAMMKPFVKLLMGR